MNRISVTLNDWLEEELRKIQGGLIAGRKHDVSFTTTINTVLLAGIIGSSKFDNDDWAAIRDFMDKEAISLDAEGLTENFINQLK